MLKYKLTDQNNMTFNNTPWGEGVTHETNGSGELCGPGWLHFYHSPELAVMLNPVHAAIQDPKLWECEAEGKILDDRGMKGGCTRLTTIREIPLPKITLEQKIRFGILCTRKVFGGKSEVWDRWSEDWLSGRDRTVASAETAYAGVASALAAADAARAAADAARATAALAAADAARARAAAYAAAYAALAAARADAAAHAAHAAYAAAHAAARAAARAVAITLDLQAVASQAIYGN